MKQKTFHVTKIIFSLLILASAIHTNSYDVKRTTSTSKKKRPIQVTSIAQLHAILGPSRSQIDRVQSYPQKPSQDLEQNLLADQAPLEAPVFAEASTDRRDTAGTAGQTPDIEIDNTQTIFSLNTIATTVDFPFKKQNEQNPTSQGE